MSPGRRRKQLRRIWRKVSDAVVKVPVYRNDPSVRPPRTPRTRERCRARHDAHHCAFTAAAVTQAWTEGQCGAQCPIHDMGRSTFDVSPLTMDMHFEVKATAGDIRLEDEDFDMNV